jgi:hypothetical protein
MLGFLKCLLPARVEKRASASGFTAEIISSPNRRKMGTPPLGARAALDAV